MKEYEICYNNCKKSDNHGQMGELDGNKQFEDFVQNNRSLLYLHEYSYLYPDLLAKITGNFPARVFRESTRGVTDKPKPTKKKYNVKQATDPNILASVEGLCQVQIKKT